MEIVNHFLIILIFQENKPCKVKNKDVLEDIAEILGTTAEKLELSLTWNVLTIGGKDTKSVNNAKKCDDNRNALSKAIYDNCFSWLV